MEEAQRVLARLERIDALRSSNSGSAELLGEVRCLLREGELWLKREREAGGIEGTERAFELIQDCQDRLVEWRGLDRHGQRAAGPERLSRSG